MDLPDDRPEENPPVNLNAFYDEASSPLPAHNAEPPHEPPAAEESEPPQS